MGEAPDVNPEMLKWARESAGLTREQAATRLKFKDTKKHTGLTKLTRI